VTHHVQALPFAMFPDKMLWLQETYTLRYVLISVFRLEESYVCRFSIDAPVSTMPTFDNDVITYLNKGAST